MNDETPYAESGRPFQKCGSCGQPWMQWSDFILDPDVRLLGFQVVTGMPDANLLVFEHCCGSSISVLVKRLRHLLGDAQPQTQLPVLFETNQCNEFCRFLENLAACDRPCANARDRQLIQAVMRMKRSDL
jgi:hypothetical protein